MKNYQCQVEIAAPVAKVFAAITTEKGLKGWWTTTCDAGAGVGSRATFRFGKTHNVMLTEKLSPNQEVVWKCLEQHHEAAELNRKDEWAGTKVKFRLESRSPSSTLLHFEHEGLTPQMECYQICEHGWGHFLKTSLKKFVETGRGEPFYGESTC
jgi:uncharacterized protein YndB with AHSA1/START domain